MKKLFYILLIVRITGPGLSFAQSGDEFNSFDNFPRELKNRVEIYPNPAIDYISVEIKESELSNTQFVLHSIIGNKLTIRAEKISNNKYRIELKNLPPGYYLLSIKDPKINFNRTYKFLKR